MESFEEKGTNILKVMEDFTGEFNVPPLDSYISYFDISTVGEKFPDAGESEKRSPCLVVKLKEPLPSGKSLPDLYKGVRVFVS